MNFTSVKSWRERRKKKKKKKPIRKELIQILRAFDNTSTLKANVW